jgi:hypothetical protein
MIVARTSTLPKRLQPMLARLTDAPLDDKHWIFSSTGAARKPRWQGKATSSNEKSFCAAFWKP